MTIFWIRTMAFSIFLLVGIFLGRPLFQAITMPPGKDIRALDSATEVRRSSLELLGVHGTNSMVSTKMLKNLMLTDPNSSFDLLVSMADNDPSKAADAASDALISFRDLKEITSRMSGVARAEFLSHYTGQLWRGSPLDVIRFTEEFPACDLPPKAIGEVAANLLPLGGERAALWLSSVALEQRAVALKDAFSGINSRSRSFVTPDAMKGWLDAAQGLNGFNSDEVQWAVAIAAKQFDLSALIKAVTLVPSSDKNAVETGMYASVSEQLARRNPAALRAQVENASNERFLSIAANALAGVDYKAALDWRHSTDDPATRAALDDGLIGFGSADMRIDLRKEICLQRLNEKPDWKSFRPAVDQLVQTYARTDPLQAADILNGLTDSETRDHIVPDFVKSWAEYDPVAASDWLIQMPASRTRDLAVKELVLASRDDPEVAVQNVAGIADRTLRLDAGRSLIETWKSLDPQWIGDLFRKMSFTSEDQAELAKSLPNPK